MSIIRFYFPVLLVFIHVSLILHKENENVRLWIMNHRTGNLNSYNEQSHDPDLSLSSTVSFMIPSHTSLFQFDEKCLLQVFCIPSFRFCAIFNFSFEKCRTTYIYYPFSIIIVMFGKVRLNRRIKETHNINYQII